MSIKQKNDALAAEELRRAEWVKETQRQLRLLVDKMASKWVTE